jgi:hypothetical protein
MSDDRIEALVAGILTDRELVLNKGSADGVEVGMRFAVLAKEGVNIADPVTGEPLGDIERPKTMVKVSRVQEKLSVAATYRTKRVGGGVSSALIFSSLFSEPRMIEEKLRADSSTYARPLKPEEAIVQVGDRAVQVIGDEFSGWNW